MINIDLNEKAFSDIDLKKYSGQCIALVNGKVVVNEKDPKAAMKRVLAISRKNKVAFICVPNSKTAMCI